MVIIDGSNVAYAHFCDRKFSVEGIKVCLECFDKMGHEFKAVVPLHQEGKLFSHQQESIRKSASSYDDRFLLTYVPVNDDRTQNVT